MPTALCISKSGEDGPTRVVAQVTGRALVVAEFISASRSGTSPDPTKMFLTNTIADARRPSGLSLRTFSPRRCEGVPTRRDDEAISEEPVGPGNWAPTDVVRGFISPVRWRNVVRGFSLAPDPEGSHYKNLHGQEPGPNKAHLKSKMGWNDAMRNSKKEEYK